MLVTGTQTNTVAPTGHGARTTTKGRAERTRNWPRHLIPARMVKKPFYRTKRCNDDDTKRHRAYTPVWRELGRVRDSRSTATDTRQQIPTTIVWQIRNQIFQFSGWESQLVNLFKYPQGYLPIHMVRAPLAHPWFLKFTQIQTFTHSSPPDKLFFLHRPANDSPLLSPAQLQISLDKTLQISEWAHRRWTKACHQTLWRSRRHRHHLSLLFRCLRHPRPTFCCRHYILPTYLKNSLSDRFTSPVPNCTKRSALLICTAFPVPWTSTLSCSTRVTSLSKVC